MWHTSWTGAALCCVQSLSSGGVAGGIVGRGWKVGVENGEAGFKSQASAHCYANVKIISRHPHRQGLTCSSIMVEMADVAHLMDRCSVAQPCVRCILSSSLASGWANAD